MWARSGAVSGHGQHAVVDELDQASGAGDRQQRLQALGLRLLREQLEGLDDTAVLAHLRGLVQVLVHVQKQVGGVVGLPGHEPGGGKRQLAPRRRLARDFLIEAQQALVGHVGLRLQDLQARTQVDQRDGAIDLLGFGQQALGAHGGVSWGSVRRSVVSVGCLAQAASWWRPAIRMEACRRVTESLLDLEWLVSRLQTRSSSMRMRHSRVLPEAIFRTWAGDREARRSAASSEMPRRKRACSRSLRMRLWASIR